MRFSLKRILHIFPICLFIFWGEAYAAFKPKIAEHIILGKWTEDKIDALLFQIRGISEASKRIAIISSHFLDTSYKGHTLIGDLDTPEKFVINLSEVDCFTFLEYIEALRRSNSYPDFKNCLTEIRYQDAFIAYETRNHFFTDWPEFNAKYIQDVSKDIGGEYTLTVVKHLNDKGNGRYWLDGLKIRKREVSYIPSSVINRSMIQRLGAGDYIGIYSEKEGLDVSHVGIFIKKGDKSVFRQATSLEPYKKVVDTPFLEYIKRCQGIIVLRPKNP